MTGQIAEDEPQIIKAWILVYSPVYDVSAPKWRFRFGSSNENTLISETTIAKDAIRRGGAMVNDAYHVELQITQKTVNTGHITNNYKVLKVLDFRPAPKQGALIFDEEDPDKDN
ncbi:MAG: hypothetical protein DHS20C09_10250 [marine bacterium B5-7]|jgi:hypothetical protein|nr:MAG: hypothetical protein DHS20C09_10250 [marine bacterium B5-7]